MSPKTFIGLAVVTVVAVLAAVVGVADRYGGTESGRSEAPVFEGLAERVNDVAEIVVRQGGDVVTIRRGEDGWVVPGKKGHPARPDKVRETIVGLADLRLFEPKTRVAGKFPRLQVEDVDAKDSASVFLRLADDSGKELAQIIVGKSRANLAGVVSSGVYVRRPGAGQAWLARGRLAPSRDAEDWLLKEIVDIASARVSRVTTRDASGAVLSVGKKAEKDAHFEIADLAEGSKLKKNAQGTVDGMASALAGLELADVSKSSDFDLAATSSAEVTTFDGLTVKVTLFADDKDTWVRVEAAGDGAAAEEAAKINARVGGWAYRIKPHKAATLKTRFDDLLDKEKKDKPS
jgi:hypothetical protein